MNHRLVQQLTVCFHAGKRLRNAIAINDAQIIEARSELHNTATAVTSGSVRKKCNCCEDKETKHNTNMTDTFRKQRLGGATGSGPRRAQRRSPNPARGDKTQKGKQKPTKKQKQKQTQAVGCWKVTIKVMFGWGPTRSACYSASLSS